MQAENIYNRLGEDLNKWQALLVQIRKARGTFDNAETKKEFGPVVIDYGKVSSACSCKISGDWKLCWCLALCWSLETLQERTYGALLLSLHLQVQSKVNLKYDSWHKEVLSKFGQMLGSNMTEFHSQISKVRSGMLPRGLPAAG